MEWIALGSNKVPSKDFVLGKDTVKKCLVSQFGM